jgi:hypothetical protein
MTLSLAIALNLLLDTAMIGGLAYVMSRAGRLAPHSSTTSGAHPALVAVAPPAHGYGPAFTGSSREPIAA